MTRKIALLLLSLLLGVSDARRSRTTPLTAPTSPQPRQLPFAGQPEETEHTWDHVDIQKMDTFKSKQQDVSPINNDLHQIEKNRDSIAVNLPRQYPSLPGSGETGELPKPLPSFVPPLLPPGCLAPRGQFPSPKSCANYLNCWDDVVVEQTCPGGLLFNDILGVCDFDYNVNCGSRPLPPPKTPLPPGSKMCPDLNGRYRSATNCSEFYVCVLGKPIKFACPRGLVYNDELNVCDYVFNVDCKGAATPKPTPLPTPEPTVTLPTVPTYRPGYLSSHPTPPLIYPTQPPPYGGNPWFSKSDDSWTQEQPVIQLEVDDQHPKQEQSTSSNPPPSLEITENTSTIPNPWHVVQSVPVGLTKVPCVDGDMHRLDESCTSVVVCRTGRPQLVQCPIAMTYDKPTDSCKPFSIAKWCV